VNPGGAIRIAPRSIAVISYEFKSLPSRQLGKLALFPPETIEEIT
jgi:hypothetical protein